jgi:hypothetical protein
VIARHTWLITVVLAGVLGETIILLWRSLP